MVCVEVVVSYEFRSLYSTVAHANIMMVWAKTHCASYITVAASRVADNWYYHWDFGDEQDLLMFTLRWA